MHIAVLSALQTELDLIVDSLDGSTRSDVGGWPVWLDERRESPLVLARAGLGKVNTAALAALIWERYHPVLMVFTGVAGGLDPELAVGDVVVGSEVVQHDAGVIAPGGRLERYQAGHLPFYNPTDQYGFTPSEKLLDTMRKVVQTVELTPVLDRRPTVTFGVIASGDQFLQDEATRSHLFTELGARAVDMEGGALGQVANRLGVDHLVVRSLSDLAQGDAVEQFDRFVPEASANSARLILGLLDSLEEDEGYHPVGT